MIYLIREVRIFNPGEFDEYSRKEPIGYIRCRDIKEANLWCESHSIPVEMYYTTHESRGKLEAFPILDVEVNYDSWEELLLREKQAEDDAEKEYFEWCSEQYALEEIEDMK